MDTFSILKSKFPEIILINNKVEIYGKINEILCFLKESPELSYDILLTIIAIDYQDYTELIYPLISTFLNEKINISIKVNKIADSVINIFPSAYFDECEIYDLFGVEFNGNESLKRLFMPVSWVGHPLKKDYTMTDERLSWNG